MFDDVVDLKDFYDSHAGHVARQLIRLRLRQFWPDVRGQEILGLGYATPYLRQFKEEASRVVAVMPAAQGVIHWPPEGPNVVALADECDLPLPDYSVDRVLLVHCLENAEMLRPMLHEIWRVLRGEGRLLVVAPNRRGLWARFERTPLGHGHPYSQGQLSRLLRANNFTPLKTERALYLPPVRSRTLLRAAPAVERLGQRWFPTFGGVVVMEAGKQLYAVKPLKQRRRLKAPVLAFPKPAGNTVTGRSAEEV